MAAMTNGQGYWLVDSGGGIFSFGGATFFGTTAGLPLNGPVVAMASVAMRRLPPDGPAVTPDDEFGDQGYWLAASDGGVFSFGTATLRLFGSAGGTPLNKPVVGMAASPDGQGYWLVAADGGVFNFGPAPFLGSMAARRLNRPIVGIAGTP